MRRKSNRLDKVQMGVFVHGMSSLTINKFHSLAHDSNHYIKGSSNKFLGTRIRGRSMLSYINLPIRWLTSINGKFGTSLITSLQPTTELRLSIAFSSFNPTAAVCTQPNLGKNGKDPIKDRPWIVGKARESQSFGSLASKKGQKPANRSCAET